MYYEQANEMRENDVTKTKTEKERMAATKYNTIR